MSTYIVDNATIDDLVLAQSLEPYGALWLRDLYHIYLCSAEAQRLAADMYAMNVRAVNGRYGDDTPEGPYAFGGGNLRGRIATYKALRCYLYQCSEGDVPEEPLYKALDTWAQRLADEIISALPEYEAAPWG